MSEEIWDDNKNNEGSLHIPQDPEWYCVDTDKINTIDDICCLIDALDIRISTDNQNINKIKHLLKGK